MNHRRKPLMAGILVAAYLATFPPQTLATASATVVAESARDVSVPPAAAQVFTPESQLQGNFRQEKTLRELPFPLRSNGTFRFASDTLVWQVLTPLASELTITPNQIQQQQNGQQVFVLDAGSQPLAQVITRIFFAVLQGNWQQLEQHFVITGQPVDHGSLNSGSATTDSTENGWQMLLTPRDASLQQLFDAIQVSGRQRIDHLQLQEPNGDVTRIWFSDVTDQ